MSVPLEIRQCWAFHVDGTRCDMPAGHPGNHSVERFWTDDECLDPTVKVFTQIPTPIPAPSPPAPKPEQDNPKCVACQHRHKGRECPGACDCREFIG